MIRRFGQTLKFSLLICFVFLAFICTSNTYAQQQVKMKLPSSEIYAGIEVGSKGVKMSLLEIAHKSKSTEIVRIVKDTSSNTDFISFTPESFSATLRALVGLIQFAQKEYQIAPTKIYTVISSGVKMQADKEKKADWVSQLIDSFKVSIADPKRIVDIVDIKEEARLSHLGIVPESRRYNTFLIDIGSGNT
ncbi:MAG: hypothetical protein ACOYKE_04975, partial [Ferruginibacter sp.]